MMTELPEFLLTIAARSSEEEGTGAMTIIVQRPYAHLKKQLHRTFTGVKGVTVIVDRRYRERRKTALPAEKERRSSDRRIPKQELIRVVLSV